MTGPFLKVLAVVSGLRLCVEQWRLPLATRLPSEEGVSSTVAKLPVADGGLCNIDDEGYAGGQRANDCWGDPTRCGVKEGQGFVTGALASVYETISI